MIKSIFPMLSLKGRSLLPIIQGGMGIGISAHRLAGTVAKEGAVGTIASVELRRLHPDIMERTRGCRDHDTLAESNLEALDREIKAARNICKTAGFLAVNVMRALPHYADQVRQACISGANAIIMGAGLPFDLPDLVRGHDQVALIPILSEERGVRAVLKKWMRKDRLPDAIVIEQPHYAGGHLGATRMEEVTDPKFDFAHVLKAVREVIKGLGINVDSIPLIPAGGINSLKSLKKLFSLGASGVQIGTPFAVTEEGDAHPNFKRVLAEATSENIVTFMSPAGLPARAVLTPWLKRTWLRKRFCVPEPILNRRNVFAIWIVLFIAASSPAIRLPANSVLRPVWPPPKGEILKRGYSSEDRKRCLLVTRFEQPEKCCRFF